MNGCYEQPAGSGTASDPYKIANAGNLYWFANKVAENASVCAELTGDITVNTNVLNADGALNGTPRRKWKAVTGSEGYNGTFDGKNFTISGLYDSGDENEGFISIVGKDGKIRNLTIADSYFYGSKKIGAVAGTNKGEIDNCHNQGCLIMGDGYLGGIAGSSTGYISTCSNSGEIRAEMALAGGIVGENDGLTVNCANSGKVTTRQGMVGGIAGQSDGNVQNCVNIGYVGCTGSGLSVGSIVGDGYFIEDNCYYLDKVNGYTSPGAMSGADSPNAFKKTFEEFESGEVAYLLQGNQETQVWGQNLGTDDYPTLGGAKVYYGYSSCGDTAAKYSNTELKETKPEHSEARTYTDNQDGGSHTVTCQACLQEIGTEDHSAGTNMCSGTKCTLCNACYGEADKTNHDTELTFDNGFCVNGCYEQPAGSGTAADPYKIANAGNLYWFAQAAKSNTSACGELTNNITVNTNVLKEDGTPNGTPARSWEPIAGATEYNGTFDGKNFTVSGLYIPEGVGSGFVSTVGESGKIRNLTIADSYFDGTLYIGVVAGTNKGEIENCHNISYVHGTQNIGGITGCNYGSVKNCANSGEIVAMDDYVGGIAGFNDGIIENCVNIGYVISKGDGEHIGSIAGNGTNITNCYYLDKVGGNTNPGGIENTDVTGAAEKKTAAQFASGEVAYLLQGSQETQVWGQTIGTDDYPSLGGAKVYYGYASCGDTAAKYSNTELAAARPEHTGEASFTDDKTGTHTVTYGCCGTGEKADHEFTFRDGVCICGAIMPDAIVTVQIGEIVTAYDNLFAAFNAVGSCVAEDNAIVKLLESAETEGETVYSGVFTLDLNGKVLDFTGETDDSLLCFAGETVNVTICNGTIRKNGDKYGSAISALVGTVSMNDVTVTCDLRNAIFINGATVNFNGGKISSNKGYVCQINNGTLNVNGGELISKSSNLSAIYMLGGNMVINDGTISGDLPAVFAASGASLTVSGGTVTSKNDYAIYGSDASVNITGGTIQGELADLFVHEAVMTLTLAEGAKTGAFFPGGIKVGGTTLKNILADGIGFRQNGQNVNITDEQTEISGDVQVVSYCDHSKNTNSDDGDCTTEVVCSVCGGVVVPAAENHSFTEFVETVMGADCMTSGYDIYKCENCDETENRENAQAKQEHSFGEWEPVDGDFYAGMTRTCTVCTEETETAKVMVCYWADDSQEVRAGYQTLEEALAEVPVWADVILLSDCEVEELQLGNYNHLDLNGHILTAEYVLVDETAYILDRKFETEAGKLKVSRENVILSGQNGPLPVWNGADGYVFTWVQRYQKLVDTSTSNTAKFYFLPTFLAKDHAPLAAGSNTSGLELRIELSWTKDGEEYSMDNLKYGDELVKKFLDSYDPATGTYGLAFKLIVTGTNIIDEDSLSFRVYIKSVTGHKYYLSSGE